MKSEWFDCMAADGSGLFIKISEIRMFSTVIGCHERMNVNVVGTWVQIFMSKNELIDLIPGLKYLKEK